MFRCLMIDMMMDGPRPLFILCDRKQNAPKMYRSFLVAT